MTDSKEHLEMWAEKRSQYAESGCEVSFFLFFFLNFILFLNFTNCISFAKYQNESAGAVLAQEKHDGVTDQGDTSKDGTGKTAYVRFASGSCL